MSRPAASVAMDLAPVSTPSASFPTIPMLPEARCEECHDLLSDWCDPLECNAQNRRKQPHIHHVDRDGRRLSQLESNALMHFYSAAAFQPCSTCHGALYYIKP